MTLNRNRINCSGIPAIQSTATGTKAMTSKLKYLVATSIISAAIVGASSAHAAGTAPGTDILNTVNVNFQVGGVSQTAVQSSNTFDVDRKVIFTLTEATPTGATSVTPGQTNAVTTFTLSNTSNDTLDFTLAMAQLGNGTGNTEHALNDAFDINAPTTAGTGSPTYFVDTDPDGAGPLTRDGIYTPGVDTDTVVNNLAADGSIRIFIVGSIPLTATDGQAAGVTLTGTALNSDGSAIVAATDSDVNTAGIETIFADTGRNGIESDGDDYEVNAAALTVKKYSRVISDGVSVTNPKAIPGAIVEYCIAVSNAAGAATANGVGVSDNLGLPAIAAYAEWDVTGGFVPGLDGTAVTVIDAPTNMGSCTVGGTAVSYTGGTNGTVSGTLTDIAAGETRTLVFRVKIK
jgi:hypothetical protein